jgi:hypothetical protein
VCRRVILPNMYDYVTYLILEIFDMSSHWNDLYVIIYCKFQWLLMSKNIGLNKMKILTIVVTEDFKLVFQQKSIMQAMTGHLVTGTAAQRLPQSEQALAQQQWHRFQQTKQTQ